MPASMTGFGRGEALVGGRTSTVEIRSVNHRFLEFSVRLPRQLAGLEERVRNLARERVSRGHLDILVNLAEGCNGKRQVKLDKELAAAYYNLLRELQETLAIPSNIDVFSLAQLPGVLSVEQADEDLEEAWALVEPALQEALARLVAMRQEEGYKLTLNLAEKRVLLLKLVDSVEERTPLVVEEYRLKLQGLLKGLLAGSDREPDPVRLAQEVAFLAERSSIDEEIVRLRSHLEQFGELIRSEAPQGRKLDFLVQEMLREVNTIGAKAGDLAINRLVVEAKGELEKVKEQVQNLE